MKKYILTLTLLLLTILCLAQPIYAESGEDDDKRVLFISSYSYAWDTVQIQIDGIKQGIGDGITLDYEFMDTKRFPDEESIEHFYLDLSERLKKLEPYDVIIVGDDAALTFAVEHHNDIFKGIPIVFEGVNNEAYAFEVSKSPLVTGILEKLSFQKNIDFARTLFPNATKVVAILDNSVTGEAERKSFYSYAASFPDLQFSEINTSELSSEELKQSIAGITKDTILIYIVMTEDATGKKYTNSQSIKLISENSSVPAFRMVSGGIGEGLLGGNIVSMELSGKIAAQMATEIVNGRDPATYDVIVESPNIYCIDESVMLKYGLDITLIPDDAEIVNHQPTFVERNIEMIIPTIVAAIFLLTIILLMVIRYKRQLLITNDLQQVTEDLEHSSLHDFLTELPNRTKLYADLTELFLNNSICTLFILDIDGFKQINDTYGHAAGDEVLRQVGLRLNSLTDDYFTSYRLAGDEFVCILKNNFESQIDSYANKCIELFKENVQYEELSLPIRISLGIAVYPNDTSDMKTLMEYADQAMYHVKKNGKNSYVRYRDIKK